MGLGAVFFDLYGTLLPLGPLDAACERLAPGRGHEVAVRWRARQLEATWLRTIMDRWVGLDTVTLDALRSTLVELGVEADEQALMETTANFPTLPLDEAAAETIQTLRDAGLRLGILTNASEATLRGVMARLKLPLEFGLSADSPRRFKPHPAIYERAVHATGLPADRIGFVTSNGWDAAGAGSFGLRVAWLRPSGAVMPSVGAPDPRIVTWADIPRVLLDS